jgi:hypothetical protein
MLSSRIKVRIIAKLLVLAALITVAAFTLFGDRKTFARPCHEVEHDYYADDTYGELVGYKLLYCNGTYTWGTVTAYDLVIDGDPCCDNCPDWCE